MSTSQSDLKQWAREHLRGIENCIFPSFDPSLEELDEAGVGLGLAADGLPAQSDEAGWPVLRAAFTQAFAGRPRDAWTAVFDGVDACVTPVVELAEVADEPHLLARGTFVSPGGVQQAAPAPRFSRTPAQQPAPPGAPAVGVADVLAGWASAQQDVAGRGDR